MERLKKTASHPLPHGRGLLGGEDKTYFDLFSDLSCDTPTHAGEHIVRQIQAFRLTEEHQKALMQHKKDIFELHKSLNDGWEKKLNELREQKEKTEKEFNAQILEISRSRDKTVKEKADFRTYCMLTIAAVIIIALILIFYR